MYLSDFVLTNMKVTISCGCLLLAVPGTAKPGRIPSIRGP